MGAFELNDFKGNNLGNNLSNNQINSINNINNNVNNIVNNQDSTSDNTCCRPLDTRSVREENIISLKIYDSCRQQDCNNIIQLQKIKNRYRKLFNLNTP